MTDKALLERFVSEKNDAAFAKIVERYSGMVYATCLRDLHDRQLAEDAAQCVFVLLVQKAGSLTNRDSLSGWLFLTARYVSRDLLRAENTRRARESEAIIMENCSDRSSLAIWVDIEPELNDALASLPSSDRDVILKRFIGGLSIRELSEAIGISEGAAAKRLLRAVERMRRYFTRHGVTVSSSMLISTLVAQGVGVAPPSLVHSIHSAMPQALQTGQQALPSGSIPGALLKGALVMTTKQIVAGVSIAVSVLLIGTAAVIYHSHTVLDAGVQPSQVEWNNPAASDPTTQVVAGQVHAQLQKFFNVYSSRNVSDVDSIISPDCVEFSSGKSPKHFTVTQAEIANLPADMSEACVVNSFSVSGNTAVIGIVAVGHDNNFNLTRNGHRVYYSSDIGATLTFTDTGGQWLMTRVDDGPVLITS